MSDAAEILIKRITELEQEVAELKEKLAAADRKQENSTRMKRAYDAP